MSTKTERARIEKYLNVHGDISEIRRETKRKRASITIAIPDDLARDLMNGHGFMPKECPDGFLK